MSHLRIEVISDTHGIREKARAAVNRMGQVDLLLHAGDHYDDVVFLSNLYSFPIIGVRGNCDFVGPQEEVVDAGGIKLLLTHGHQYGVKRSLLNLVDRAREVGARVVVFGHTHEPETEWVDDILLFNPGSAAKPRGVSLHSFGILTVEDGKIQPYIGELE